MTSEEYIAKLPYDLRQAALAIERLVNEHGGFWALTAWETILKELVKNSPPS